jgi:4-alpha-glucanotransferase
MRHSGALRIDHIIGWRRLFVIPDGAAPASGAYVNFPLDDLLAIAALESHRNRCVIIGEDLGTVPEGFRDRMTAENILSCRIFYFERDHERFHKPNEYPALAAASASTHDLATLHGFWRGDDIDAKTRIGAYASGEAETAARAERAKDKRRLLEALVDENLLPPSLALADVDHAEWTPRLAEAIQLFLSRAPSLLLMIQLDDLANELHQANVPGSTAEYPNWRRRIARPIEDLLNSADMQNHLAEIAQARQK